MSMLQRIHMTKDLPILLMTLNAQYIHSSFALRYLKANLHELQSRCAIREYTINDQPLNIVEEVLSLNPSIIGLSIYIWNVQQTLAVLRIIQRLRPDITIVLGGPEVSYETTEQPIVDCCDYVVIGEGEVSFYQLCKDILRDQRPAAKIIPGRAPDVNDLAFPYSLYSDEDIQNRVLYVEASRGCPFRCQFCLSALDAKVRNFPLAAFLSQMQQLIDRGARQFKFIDRTFNLSPKISTAILQFFLDQQLEDLFLHFEMVPDRFPPALRQYITQFPEGSIQFEVGIQSFNPEVTGRIQRRQNTTKIIENLTFLRDTGVHLHTDLIIGLPGEDLQSFANGFDQLVQLDVEEIQVGILKRLRGAPIALHTAKWEMVYSPDPPYEILRNNKFAFTELARLKRFARYWNIIGNSGRFHYILRLFKESASPFEAFLEFSDWLYETCQRTHKISFQNMLRYLHQYWTEEQRLPETTILELLRLDYQRTTGKPNTPHFLRAPAQNNKRNGSGTTRQQRHRKEGPTS